MIIPRWLFQGALWFALVVVALAATYLLVMLIREWVRGELW